MTEAGAVPFSTALHRAVDTSHLSLAQIVERLSQRGFKISRTTLSQWQTGTSIPRRTSSRMLINELENILALPPGSLTSLLESNKHRPPYGAPTHHPQSQTPRNDMGSTPTYVESAHEKHMHSLNEIINPETEVTRESLEERLHVSEDYHTIEHDLSILVRIPDTTKPILHTTTWWTKDNTYPDEVDIGLYDIRGCFPASTQTTSFDDGLAKITRLEFPPYVTPNSLHRVAYKIRFQSDTPFTETTERIIASKLRYYFCSVTFEGEAPHSLQWVSSKIDADDPHISHVTSIRDIEPHNNSAQVTFENIEYATGMFRWDVHKTLNPRTQNTVTGSAPRRPLPSASFPASEDSGEPPLSSRQDF